MTMRSRFIALLDFKMSIGYDFTQTADDENRKRVDEIFQAIDLGLSNLGGPDAVAEFFSRNGNASYQDRSTAVSKKFTSTKDAMATPLRSTAPL